LSLFALSSQTNNTTNNTTQHNTTTTTTIREVVKSETANTESRTVQKSTFGWALLVLISILVISDLTLSSPLQLPSGNFTMNPIILPQLVPDPAPVVHFFASSLTDTALIAHGVAFALDNHRKALISLVEGVDKVIERIVQLDSKSHHRFAAVHTKMKSMAVQLPALWEVNELVFRQLLQPNELDVKLLLSSSISGDEQQTLQQSSSSFSSQVDLDETLNGGNDSASDQTKKSDIAAYNSIAQLIVHLNRDWSEFGSDVRKRLYFDAIVPSLVRYLPVSQGAHRVLVPGAGLGRLAMEIAAVGYHVGKLLCIANTVLFFECNEFMCVYS
jgi:hypothetical protein